MLVLFPLASALAGLEFSSLECGKYYFRGRVSVIDNQAYLVLFPKHDNLEDPPRKQLDLRLTLRPTNYFKTFASGLLKIEGEVYADSASKKYIGFKSISGAATPAEVYNMEKSIELLEKHTCNKPQTTDGLEL